VDEADLAHHECPDDDERRRGDLGGDDRDEGCEEHRDGEEKPRHDVGEARPRPFADPGAGLDEDRVRGARGEPAGDRADALDDQRGLQAGEVAVLVGHARLLRQPGHGAHGVEEVGEHEREDEHECRERADAAESAEEVDLADEGEVGDGDQLRRELRLGQAPSAGIDRVAGDLGPDVPDRFHDDREHGARDEADEDAAFDSQRDERSGRKQGDDEDQRRDRGDRSADPEAHGRRVATGGGDEAGVDESDEGDEEPDADGDRQLELHRHGIEDQPPQPRRAQQDDDQTVDHDQTHRLGPRDLADDGEREEGVDPETGGEAER
ncbi:hypothetical protein ABE10_01675, partial [Bacillus toyonensis]|nr:hypothetical protein [Bacillus toyonensis]